MAHTPGPWRVFIDDSGDQWSGWPLSISSEKDEDKTIVRTGGFYPYQWDRNMSQEEACDNAHLIASAPDLLEALKDLSAELGSTGIFADWPDLKERVYSALSKAEGK